MPTTAQMIHTMLQGTVKPVVENQTSSSAAAATLDNYYDPTTMTQKSFQGQEEVLALVVRAILNIRSKDAPWFILDLSDEEKYDLYMDVVAKLAKITETIEAYADAIEAAAAIWAPIP